MKRDEKPIKAVVCNLRRRDAGSMVTADGRNVTWKEGLILHYVTENQYRGYINAAKVNPDAEKAVEKTLENAVWGQRIQISFDDQDRVSSVTVD